MSLLLFSSARRRYSRSGGSRRPCLEFRLSQALAIAAGEQDLDEDVAWSLGARGNRRSPLPNCLKSSITSSQKLGIAIRYREYHGGRSLDRRGFQRAYGSKIGAGRLLTIRLRHDQISLTNGLNGRRTASR